MSARKNQNTSDEATREGRDGSCHLRHIGRDGVWYVFNQEISQAQAIVFWGGAFTPNANELRTRLFIALLRAHRRGLGTPVSREFDTAITSLRRLSERVSD
ncbi:MAG: hypothetical protein AAGL90_10100 [Pseudomonadota bacterium]